MKKAFLTTLLVFGIILPVFATATFEEFYTCEDKGQKEVIIPGNVYQEYFCKNPLLYPNEKSQLKCIERLQNSNKYSLQLLNSGKCTKTTKIRVSKEYGKSTCFIDFDLNTKEVSEKMSITYTKMYGYDNYPVAIDNGCLEKLAIEIEAKYPEIKVIDSITENKKATSPKIKTINDYKVEKVNNTTFEKVYRCKKPINNGKGIQFIEFNPNRTPEKTIPEDISSELKKGFEQNYEKQVEKYNELIDLVNQGQCEINHTIAELKHTDGRICSFYYKPNAKIYGAGYEHKKLSKTKTCFKQLAKDVKQKEPNIRSGYKKYKKYGIRYVK